MVDSVPDPDMRQATKIDTTVPRSARIWNYWLGGKDHYPVDRVAGNAYGKVFPGIIDIAHAQRNFLARAVTYLAGEVEIRQFLDVGTGLPTEDNTHEVAQRIAPEARIVYVDNDPLVLVHARALLTSTPEGVTNYVEADVRDTDTILQSAAATLDFTRPIALMLLGIMGHITDTDEAQRIVQRLVDGLPSGSYLVLADSTDTDTDFNAAQQDYDNTGAVPYRLRSPAEIACFFDDLDLVEPGVVTLHQWRPELGTLGPLTEVAEVCGVARTS